jgi:Na+-driven multidrug efflux pump
MLTLFLINIMPDSFRSNLRGVIKALELQQRIVWVHIIGSGFLNTALIYFFAFYLDLGLEGIWIAKIIMELYLNVCYLWVIHTSDWYQIAADSVRR